MYCSHCGKPMDPASRFCSACGAAWQPMTYARRPLTRPRHPRMIAGVCAAFALEYGWDLALVRVITALFIVLTGVGLFAYLASWIVIPDAAYALPERSVGVGSAGGAGSSV